MAGLTFEIVDLRVRRGWWRRTGGAARVAGSLGVAVAAVAASATIGLLLTGVRFAVAGGRIGLVMPSRPGVGQQAVAYGHDIGTVLAYGPAVVTVAGGAATTDGVAVAAAVLPAAAAATRQTVSVPSGSVVWITSAGVLTAGPASAVHAVVYWPS